jgi:formylglycine-generating enzyme required for sulfatase activity
MMGSPGGESGRSSDETQHQVKLTRGFWMMEKEMTQGQYSTLTGLSPSGFSSRGQDCPVEQVTWYDALRAANALSKKEGKETCYTETEAGKEEGDVKEEFRGSNYYKCKGWRLPTEAEWEYAARAGTTGERYGNLDDIAWYGGNSGRRTHAVGGKQANAWGLYDMLGNVWEWVYDWHGSYDTSVSPAIDPAGPSSGSYRVCRGGSWLNNASFVRAAQRSGSTPRYLLDHLGVRLVLSLSSK